MHRLPSKNPILFQGDGTRGGESHPEYITFAETTYSKEMKIVADSAIPYLKGVLEPYAEVVYLSGGAFSTADVRDADALIVRTRTRCGEQLLAGSRVRLIATATIGFDHIDLEYCRREGIEVATAAGCNARGVLQWVGAALAWLSRREGWAPRDKRLGIVGVGHVGSLVREYAENWGFRVLCCDPPREAREHAGFLPLEEVVRHSDLLSFHVPLDRTTFHMGDAALFALLPGGAVVLNSSRGEVLDETALLSAGLDCILDVWEHEPNLNDELLAKALLATPHIAGYSAQGKANATAAAVRCVAARFALPLEGWYPSHAVSAQRPRPIGWEELCATVGTYFDMEAQSRRLKADPQGFEHMRNSYAYRQEYF